MKRYAHLCVNLRKFQSKTYYELLGLSTHGL